MICKILICKTSAFKLGKAGPSIFMGVFELGTEGPPKSNHNVPSTTPCATSSAPFVRISRRDFSPPSCASSAFCAACPRFSTLHSFNFLQSRIVFRQCPQRSSDGCTAAWKRKRRAYTHADHLYMYAPAAIIRQRSVRSSDRCVRSSGSCVRSSDRSENHQSSHPLQSSDRSVRSSDSCVGSSDIDHRGTLSERQTKRANHGR